MSGIPVGCHRVHAGDDRPRHRLRVGSLEGAMSVDWRQMLDYLADRMRKLEVVEAEVIALRAALSESRERERQLDSANAAFRARDRAANKVRMADPDRLGDVTIEFGQTPDDAVPVPRGSGNAQFVYGLLEVLVTDDRPVYLRVERKPHEIAPSVQSATTQEEE